jgi:hypothetical protein
LGRFFGCDAPATCSDITDGYDNYDRYGHLHCGAIFSNSENVHNSFIVKENPLNWFDARPARGDTLDWYRQF